jgi:hypothetical protein
LVCAGVAAVGFTYLFGLENTWTHRLMVVPWRGDRAGAVHHRCHGAPLLRRGRIGTGAFELVLERFVTNKLSNLRYCPNRSRIHPSAQKKSSPNCGS